MTKYSWPLPVTFVVKVVISLSGIPMVLSTTSKRPCTGVCASVAAASIRAKVDRDALLREAHEAHPHYAWASNKGYGAKAHYDGIAAHGLTEMHRRTWIR